MDFGHYSKLRVKEQQVAKFRKFDPSNKKKRRDREYMERDRKMKSVKNAKPLTRDAYQWQDEVSNYK